MKKELANDTETETIIIDIATNNLLFLFIPSTKTQKNNEVHSTQAICINIKVVSAILHRSKSQGYENKNYEYYKKCYKMSQDDKKQCNPFSVTFKIKMTNAKSTPSDNSQRNNN